MRLCLIILWWAFASTAAADRVRLQAGDHEGFSRLVFYHQGGAPTLEAGDDRQLRLSFDDPVSLLGMEDVYFYISRERVAEIGLDNGDIILDLACDCVVEAAPLRNGIFVLDARSGGGLTESRSNSVSESDGPEQTLPREENRGRLGLDPGLGLQPEREPAPLYSPRRSLDGGPQVNPGLLFDVSRYLGGQAAFGPWQGAGPGVAGPDVGGSPLSDYVSTKPVHIAGDSQSDCDSSYFLFLENVERLFLTPQADEFERSAVVNAAGQIDQDSALQYFTDYFVSTFFQEAGSVVDFFDDEAWRQAAQDLVSSFTTQRSSVGFSRADAKACGDLAWFLAFLSPRNLSSYSAEDVVNLLEFAAKIDGPIGAYIHGMVLQRGEEAGLLTGADFRSGRPGPIGARAWEPVSVSATRSTGNPNEDRVLHAAQGHVLSGSDAGDALFLDLVSNLIEAGNIFGAWVELRQQLNSTYLDQEAKRRAGLNIVAYLAEEASAPELAILMSDDRFLEFLDQLTVTTGSDWGRILTDRSQQFVTDLASAVGADEDQQALQAGPVEPVAEVAEEVEAGDRQNPGRPHRAVEHAAEVFQRSNAVLEQSIALEAEIRALLD